MASKCLEELRWGFNRLNKVVLLHLVRNHQVQEDVGCSWTAVLVVFFLQELRGKILLKAKKIGGLEESVDESLVDDVSDEEEAPNGDADSPNTEDPPAVKNDEVHLQAAF